MANSENNLIAKFRAITNTILEAKILRVSMKNPDLSRTTNTPDTPAHRFDNLITQISTGTQLLEMLSNKLPEASDDFISTAQETLKSLGGFDDEIIRASLGSSEAERKYDALLEEIDNATRAIEPLLPTRQ